MCTLQPCLQMQLISAHIAILPTASIDALSIPPEQEVVSVKLAYHLTACNLACPMWQLLTF